MRILFHAFSVSLPRWPQTQAPLCRHVFYILSRLVVSHWASSLRPVKWESFDFFVLYLCASLPPQHLSVSCLLLSLLFPPVRLIIFLSPFLLFPTSLHLRRGGTRLLFVFSHHVWWISLISSCVGVKEGLSKPLRYCVSATCTLQPFVCAVMKIIQVYDWRNLPFMYQYALSGVWT